MTDQLKPIDRPSLIKQLEHQGFRVEEAAYENLDDLRVRYANDIGPGELAWKVRDPRSHKEVKRVVVYGRPDRPPPYRGIVKKTGSDAAYFVGEVVVDEDGVLLFLRSKEGLLERINGI